MALLETRTERCNECTISTHGLRKTLARSLGVNRYQAHLLVSRIVVKLLENGVLEYWVSVGRGDVYRINLEKLEGIAPMPEMTSSL
jgi:hypothetical protein